MKTADRLRKIASQLEKRADVPRLTSETIRKVDVYLYALIKKWGEDRALHTSWSASDGPVFKGHSVALEGIRSIEPSQVLALIKKYGAQKLANEIEKIVVSSEHDNAWKVEFDPKHWGDQNRLAPFFITQK